MEEIDIDISNFIKEIESEVKWVQQKKYPNR
jgi:hypothetical protein